MDLDAIFDAVGRTVPTGLLILLGVALVWRGLRGGRNGQRGLLRRRVGVLGRVEGFRLVIVGLALTAIGAGWLWQVPWLLFLGIGMGIVEGLESSAIIAAMRRAPSGARRGHRGPRPAAVDGHPGPRRTSADALPPRSPSPARAVARTLLGPDLRRRPDHAA